MNRNSRIILTIPVAVAMVLLVGVVCPASAQYVISARGGLVNHTTGPVSYNTVSDPTWRDVPGQLQLDEGDRIKTESWGRAEMLLNPGSYLRIGNGAEMAMLSTELGATAVELVSGSVVLEVGDLKGGGVIRVQTHITNVRIKKDGLYRLDVESDAITLTVRHGEAFFLRADGKLEKVKKGKRVLITSNDYRIARLDTDRVDEFDLWSADRAEMLMAANQSLIRRMGWRSWPGLAWSAWVFDPFYGCYTFFPWGHGFRSVYGHGYYNPWYPYGNWGGDYGPGGPAGPRGPGDKPPARPAKPSYGDRANVGKPVNGPVGTGGDGSFGRQPGSFPKHGSTGSSSGSIGGAPPMGHAGNGTRGGGNVGGRMGSAPNGPVSGGVKSGGKNGKH